MNSSIYIVIVVASNSSLYYDTIMLTMIPGSNVQMIPTPTRARRSRRNDSNVIIVMLLLMIMMKIMIITLIIMIILILMIIMRVISIGSSVTIFSHNMIQ